MLIFHNNFNKEVMVGRLNSEYFATEPYNREVVFDIIKENLDLVLQNGDMQAADQELMDALFEGLELGVECNIKDVIIIPHYFSFTINVHGVDVMYDFPIIIVEV